MILTANSKNCSSLEVKICVNIKMQNIEDFGKLENGKRRTEINVPQAVKFRKVCAGVRKELFKSQCGSQKKYKNGSNSNWSPERCWRYLSNLPSLDNSIYKEGTSSNLTNQSAQKRVEFESTENKNDIKDSLKKFKLPATPQQKSMFNYKSPDTSDYLKLEKLCERTAETKESPVSSVCNLLENNMLLNSGKKTKRQHEETIETIKDILKKDREFFEDTSTKIKGMLETMQMTQQENYDEIMHLVETLHGTDDDFPYSAAKENYSPMKRRSLRLQKRSPMKKTGSPVILKAGDLRKSTLTKSLVSKCQKYQIDSPRLQNAISMYNATRNTCSALLTPKILRNQSVESPKSSNWRANLSIKVQQQCLMLQDTPKHN